MNTPAIRTTVIGVALARLYFAVLLDHLKAELSKPEHARDITLQYGELVKRAKRRFATAPYIDAAIPTNIGSRLLVVQLICERLGLPNLACLGVNAKGEPGEGYLLSRNWDLDKAAVLAFPWDSVSADVADAFEAEAKGAAERVAKKARPAVSEKDARDMLWEAASANPGAYQVDNYQKEAMVRLIMKGLSVDDAYAEVTD
jgi:hypothetical protein